MLNFREQKNSKLQGNIGLAISIAWFEEHGYNTFIPLTDSQDEDLVVKKDGEYFGVQVKTTYAKTEYGVYRANLRVLGGNRSGTGKVKNFDPTKIDLLFIVTEARDMYLIPTGAITNVNCINLGAKYEAFKVYSDYVQH